MGYVYIIGHAGLARGAPPQNDTELSSPCAVRRKKNRNQDEVSSSAARISASSRRHLGDISARSRPAPPADAAMTHQAITAMPFL